MKKYFDIYPLGDKGITIVLGTEITPHIHQKVKQVAERLTELNHPAIIEVVPTYTTVTLYYYRKKISYRDMTVLIEKCLSNLLDEKETDQIEVIEIPVYYGGTWGPDLKRVAQHTNLSEEEVVRKHSSETYLIYMLGFLPGFPYLGGLPLDLATPRLDSPRRSVDAGSVGIAGNQTGIYPLTSPGGWNIIGQTPTRIYQPGSDTPFLLSSGMYIKFKPI